GSQVLNALNQMERVGAFERIGIPWQQAGLRWSSDRVFHRIDLQKLKDQTGFLPISVAAPDLRELLMKSIPKDSILTGHEFISFTQDNKRVEAHFSQGQAHEGQFMIAADGLDSRVRLQLMGKSEREETPLATWRVILEKDQISPDLKKVGLADRQEYLGPGLRTAYFPLTNGRLGAEFTAYAPPVPQPASEVKSYLESSFAEFPAPIPALLASIPPELLLVSYHADRTPIKQNTSGRVVLIGQAVQPTLPYLGLESNLGITDALLLARLLDESRTLKRALSQFERKRRTQVKRFYQAGHRYDRTVSLKQRFRYWLRKTIYPALPGSKAYGPFYKINLLDYHRGK
ncbi:MAG: FAD-dependent monooxygenase, partial [Bacteroidota bacterium]